MMTRPGFWAMGLLAGGTILLQVGCAVPQGRGNGRVSREVEPTMKAGYWLYLPEGYVADQRQTPGGKRWPLVVTFHGMKPYDNANPQIREWQQEADRYGFIVIAPELRTCDSFMQYPLRNPDLPYVKRDEQAIMAIMDDVFRRTDADPERVLATSWSSGGYIAHFIVNRHPERFSCIAVRQSNFGEDLLDPRQAPKYRNYPVAIFFGENDFKACREESKRAVRWYKRHRFPNVEAKYVDGLGHERTPQTAAAFFASSLGVPPRNPPDLAGLVMYDIPPEELGLPAEDPVNRRGQLPEASQMNHSSPRTGTPSRPTSSNVVFSEPPQGGSRVRDVEGTRPSYRAPGTVLGPSRDRATPRRPAQQPYTSGVTSSPTSGADRAPSFDISRDQSASPDIPAQIVVHGDTVGTAPMLVSLSLEIPDHMVKGASILWTANNEPIGTNGPYLQRILRDAGEHNIAAMLITQDGRNLMFNKKIRVIGATASQPASD